MKGSFYTKWLYLIVLMVFPGILTGQDLSSLIDNSEHTEAFWSVTVRDVSGEMLEGIHPYKMIAPASNQKLVSSAAILDHFGADHVFETHIYGEGALTNETWKGDLIIKGSGDPSISGVFYGGDRYFVFKSILDQLRSKGIGRIEGDLIADICLFDRQAYPKGWDWYDLSFYYGVEIGPLSFNNNTVDLEVFADGEVGDTPVIKWFPDSTQYVTFINEQRITGRDTEYEEYYQRMMGDNVILLRSTLPQGYYEQESLSIHDPARYFLHSLRKYLEEEGISVTGSLRISTSSTENRWDRLLASHSSPKLSELLSQVNKESDNFYTEMLLKALAGDVSGKPASYEDGIRQVKIFLNEQGLDTSKVVMKDGSGLAQGNLTQTSLLSALLVKMKAHPEGEAYFESLPKAGVDGTMSYRMKAGPLRDNFVGKSGYISGVRTLSGILKAQSGREIVVSIAANHFVSEKIRPVDAIQEQILMYLYDKY